MAWSSNSPDVTKSVSTNGAPMLANTVYTETKMNIDHFWNIGDDEDGHHKFAQMPKYEDGAVATPTSPTIAAGMDLAYFARLKTAIEATAQQDVQPYIRNASAIMQVLGIRACGVFNVAGGVSTTVYSHNCTIARTGTGRFTATFTDALPSVNYIFFGGGVAGTTTTNDIVTCEVEANTALNAVKTVNIVKFRTILLTGGSAPTRTSLDPLQGYFVVFGG